MIELNVADVRRILSHIRKSWTSHEPMQPFFPSSELGNGMTISEFSFYFIFNHHEKRHQKSNFSALQEEKKRSKRRTASQNQLKKKRDETEAKGGRKKGKEGTLDQFFSPVEVSKTDAPVPLGGEGEEDLRHAGP
jgi:hypothetical protein